VPCLEYSKNQADLITEGILEISLLKDVISCLRMPVCEGYAKFGINQKILNAMIRNRLKALGWEVGKIPLASKEHGLKINQKGDFCRKLGNGMRIFGEVEFGNSSSVFRDFFKFGFVRDIDTYDIGILVVPSENCSREIERIMSFQDVTRVLDHVRGSIQTPILVLGIQPDRNRDIDCYELEPRWEREDWRNQSEPDWDSFVTKHEDALFDHIGTEGVHGIRFLICRQCGMDVITEYGYCNSIGCINDDYSDATRPGILVSYVNTLIHTDEGQGVDVFGNPLTMNDDEIDDIFDEGISEGICSLEEAEAAKDRLRRFGEYGDA